MLARTPSLFAVVLLFGNVAQAAAVRLPKLGRVRRALDGDTVVVRASSKNYNVRLIGVDAPELYTSAELDRDTTLTRQEKRTLIELGKKSAKFTDKLCRTKSCKLEYDQANAAEGHRDAYGRLLAYLWIKDRKGKPILVNAQIIRQGYARAYVQYPFDKDFRDLFTRLQQEARAGRRGLWAAGVELQWPTLSRTAVVGNKRSKKYHLPSCTAAQRMSPENRTPFKNAANARAAGYVPCKLCNPG